MEIGKDDALALSRGGYALTFVVGDLDYGAACVDRALVLNPNLATAWYFSGRVKVYLGEPEVAIEHAAHAMRLSPLDPTAPPVTFVGQALRAVRRWSAQWRSDKLPAFGRPTGVVVNYAPVRAVAFDTQENPQRLLARARRKQVAQKTWIKRQPARGGTVMGD